MIDYNFHDVELFAIPDDIAGWLEFVAIEEGKRIHTLSIHFLNDQAILEMNVSFLQHDYATDIITFDNSKGSVLYGELFISIDTVRTNAEIYKQAFSEELQRVLVHGVLHLCGYKDKEPQEQVIMRGKEDYYLQKLNVSRETN